MSSLSFIIQDEIGMIHLISSLIATFFGTLVLVLKKGTQSHIRVGYVYCISMFLLLVSAFMIYRLFGSFGIFHIAALISSLTLLAGMLPIWFKYPRKKWLGYHLSFMYWSVIGLYAAFASETLTRIPETPFFGMVGVATLGITLLGNFFFRKYMGSWEQIRQYGNSKLK